MNKSIYLSVFAALALTACSNDTDQIFDQSAAERLEQYKKEYAEVLSSDGGLWSMEYFANPDEPGYVFVMKFDKNGSVEISANHIWIGSEFKQETSLWKMIADNGPVLSFNSYNDLFHIFSDPADITGPNAPTGDNGDIIETGFGHEGDYEFQVMEVSDDRNTVRLLGKKRLYDIFLRRLDPSANIQEYLDRSVKAADFLSPYFNYVNLIDEDGEEYVMTDLSTGIPSVYPKLGDAVEQTRSGNGIFTVSGFRFMNPLEIPRTMSFDDLVLDSFDFQPDGSLLSKDGKKIVGPYPIDVLIEPTLDYIWNVNLESVSGSLAAMFQKLTDGLKEAYPTRSLESVYFSHEVLDGEVVPALNVKISGAKSAVYYMAYSSALADDVKFSIVGANSQASTFEKKTMALTEFAKSLADMTYSVSSASLMAPEVIVIKDNANKEGSMEVVIN